MLRTPRGPDRNSRLGAALEAWARALELRNARPRTIASYLRAVRAVAGGAALERLMPATRATYAAACRAWSSWSSSSTGVRLRTGEASGRIALAAALRVRLDAGAPKPHSAAEDAALLAGARRARWRVRLWYALMREAGLRPSEPLRLRWADVELEPGREAVTIREAKGRADATVPLELGGAAGLVALLRRRRRAAPASEFVLSDAGAGPWSYTAAWEAWRRLADDAAVSGGPHRCRHTAATAWLRRGLDGEIVRRLLRHRTPAMVARYAELAPEDLRRRLLDVPGRSRRT